MSDLERIPVTVEVDAQATNFGNVTPLLHEIRHALQALLDSNKTTVIDLLALPLAPGELDTLEQRLGVGEVRAEVQALGLSELRETRYPGVWWVVHYNTNQEIMARNVEIARIPELLLAQMDDMREALSSLDEELKQLD